MTSSVAYHHFRLTEYMFRLRRPWHSIMALVQYTRSDDVKSGMTSLPLDIIYHVGLCRACHAIISLGKHTRKNDDGHVIFSSPLECTQGRTASGVKCHHCTLDRTHGRTTSTWHTIIALGLHTRINDVERGIPSSPLCSTHGGTTSGMACHHRLCIAQTVVIHQAWNVIIP